MEPLFFGESQSPLFGAYHPPTGPAREHGVLICAPIAQEYLRAHWAIRQLARSLARAGFHVLRFDWYGIGDSAGESRAGSVARWIDDVSVAAAELRDMAAVQRVSVVGLRLGAPLAVAAVAKGLRAHELVLWDPVVRGSDYLHELEALDVGVRGDPTRYGFSLRRTLAKRWLHLVDTPRVERELIGFAFPDSLRREIDALDTSAMLAAKRHERVRLACSEERASYRTLATQLGVIPTIIGPSAGWDDSRGVARLLLPGALLQTMTAEILRADV